MATDALSFLRNTYSIVESLSKDKLLSIIIGAVEINKIRFFVALSCYLNIL